MILLRRYYRYIILLFLCLSAIFVGTLFNRTHSAEFSKETAQNAVTASRQTAIVTAVAKASPAVVNISAVRSVEQRTSFDDWFWGEIRQRAGVLSEKSALGLLLTKMDTSSRTITSSRARIKSLSLSLMDANLQRRSSDTTIFRTSRFWKLPEPQTYRRFSGEIPNPF